MPPLNDIFSSNAFGMIELTESINLAPYQPGRLGQLGIFETRNPSQNIVAIERQGATISILPVKARGTDGTKLRPNKRDMRNFELMHIPHDDEVLASEVSGVREFRTENQLKTVASVVNDKLENMRQNHEVTHEWHRVGAIQGNILDADGVTSLLNLFTEFGIAQPTLDFALNNAATNVKQKCVTVRRTLEGILQGITFTGIIGICGDTFWDSLISHPSVENAYNRWQDGEFLRVDQRAPAGADGSQGMSADPPLVERFRFGSIQFENYRGSIGGTPFIPATDCRFVVQGVRGLFLEHFGPADFMETVNTRGQKIYAKQERMKYDRGVELHSESNVLFICTRPNTLIRGYTA